MRTDQRRRTDTRHAVHRPPPDASPAPGIAVLPEPRLKRLADIALAAVLLVPAVPLVLAAWALVRLTSAGPGVYTQARVGRGGRVFTLYKLRTMLHDCESLTGARWSLPGDPRVTPVGHVLRDLHLDELPQLLNVLKGDMSLIGPRPERPEIVADLREAVPGYDRRLAVRPGITGYAQVHLPPDTDVQSVRRKLVFDRFYLRHRGARLGAFIALATGLKLLGLRRLYTRRTKIMERG
ncbi:MAG: sugar transferase [Gemmataceae bacterium]|nr:sugar transferase [Gemmataceae bacterium]